MDPMISKEKSQKPNQGNEHRGNFPCNRIGPCSLLIVLNCLLSVYVVLNKDIYIFYSCIRGCIIFLRILSSLVFYRRSQDRERLKTDK